MYFYNIFNTSHISAHTCNKHMKNAVKVSVAPSFPVPTLAVWALSESWLHHSLALGG